MKPPASEVRFHATAIAVTLALTLSWWSTAAAQSVTTQTLPAGYENVMGNDLSTQPFMTTGPQIWHWHYDASEFQATGPITIRELWVRPNDPLQALDVFQFTGFEVTLIEASTDYQPGARGLLFADNVLRSARVNSTGAFLSPRVPPTGASTSNWIRLDLTGDFYYDPTTGNDFIIQVRTCSPILAWSQAMDAVSGPLPTLGGNAYGGPFGCNALVPTAIPNGLVPVIRIDYTEVQSQTIPAGYENVNGNANSSNFFNTSGSMSGQYHYDSGEFAHQGPIAITEIAVRANTSSQVVQPFSFPDLRIRLIEASTDYVSPSHLPVFEDNVLRAKTVRSGAFTSEHFQSKNSGGPTGVWIDLQLEEPFLYDPSTGNDFIIEMRCCGPVTPFGVNFDADTAPLGTLGGDSYIDVFSCTGTSSPINTISDGAPIFRVDWVPATVSSFPWEESFDMSRAARPPLAWDQGAQDSGDWYFADIGTASSGTGPSSDHTLARPEAGRYGYIESSFFNQNPINLVSPWFDLTTVGGSAGMTFWAHSTSLFGGLLANDLSVDIEIAGGALVSDVIAPITHTDEDRWQQRFVSLASYANDTVRFIFRGRSDSTSFHDIAIDDVRVFRRQLQLGQRARAGLALLDVNESLNAEGVHTALSAAGPYFSDVRVGESMQIHFEGEPDKVIIFFAAPLFVGVGSLGPQIGQFDVGSGVGGGGIPTGLGVIGDGNQPTFPDVLYRTDFLGDLDFHINVPAQLAGQALGFQAFVYTDQSFVIALTNAVEVSFGN